MKKYKLRNRWSKMLSRCEDEDYPQFKDYGGRGIAVCKEWHDFQTFYRWCISNGAQENLQLNRIDNNGNYEPNNCNFLTRSQNDRNKRNSKMLTAFNETKTMIDWSEDPRCAVNYKTLLQRVRRGWSHEDSISVGVDETRKFVVPHNVGEYEAFGDKKTLSGWIDDSRCKNKNRATIHARIKRGWTIENALGRP